MNARSRNFKVYTNRFEYRQKPKFPPKIFKYELKAIASTETFFATGKNLECAIASHFENELKQKVSGIAFFCRHGRKWYSATKMETTIKVERVY